MIRPTGSKVHRFWKCPTSAVLPQIEDDDVSPFAARGRDVHAFLEHVRSIGLAEALERAPADLRVLLSCLNLDELPAHLATEVAFLYDYKARTAREIGRNIGRDYDAHLARTLQRPRAPTEIALTIDLAGVEARGSGRRGYVGDYKTGRTKYPSPDRFGQTLLAALCMHLAHGCDDVIAELIYVREGGDAYPARRTVDEWDLMTFADELEAAFDVAAHAEAEYVAGRGVPAREGPHCEHCPAYKQCPAKIALVKSIPAELAALESEAGRIGRPRAAEIWMTTERILEVLGRVRDEICGLASFDPIELPDGRVIGPITTERESLDGKIAAEVIAAWFGPEAATKASEVSVSKDALRTAAVDHVERMARENPEAKRLVIQSKKGDGVFDRVLGEIRRRGGAGMNSTTNVKPHVPRRKQLR